MSIFEYTNYKEAVNSWIKAQEKAGRGQLRKLSQFLGVNSVVMSQVFRGDRDVTIEQALRVTQFMGLTNLERDYFLLLVQKARAGSHELTQVFDQQIARLREASQSLKNRVKHQKLTDEDRITFYSHWYYSAIRLGVSIPSLNQVSAISDYLSLDRTLVARVIDFLLRNKLVIEKSDGLDIGPQVTHIGHDSAYVSRHHSNWRLQGLQAMEKSRPDDLFYSGPMVVSEVTARRIRNSLVELVEKTTKEITKSDSEVLRCLNLDWFKLGSL